MARGTSSIADDRSDPVAPAAPLDSVGGMKRIAFLGLGTMGSGMARRLLGAGFAVTVHNRTRHRADALVAAGAVWAASPAESAESADAIVAMVADDLASRTLWLGHEGALAGARAGTLAIECSTLTGEWSTELRAAAGAAGLSFLDAPVTGSKPQADAGELVFMVGGDGAVLETAQPVLRAMGNRIVHVGAPGAGTIVKLMNNFLSGVQIASFGEALALLRRAGIDPEKAMEVILPGSPGSLMLRTVYSRLKAGDDRANFTVKLMAKDLGYAQQEATRRQLSLRTASAPLALFQESVAHGDGDKDISSLARRLQNV